MAKERFVGGDDPGAPFSIDATMRRAKAVPSYARNFVGADIIRPHMTVTVYYERADNIRPYKKVIK